MPRTVTVELTGPQTMVTRVAGDDRMQHLVDNGYANSVAVLARVKEKIQSELYD